MCLMLLTSNDLFRLIFSIDFFLLYNKNIQNHSLLLFFFLVFFLHNLFFYRTNLFLILLLLLWFTILYFLKSFEKLSFFFKLFLSLFLFLPFQTFFLSSIFCSFYFFLTTLQKLISHFLLSFSLLSFKFKISFFISLSTISIIPKTSSCHGSGNILNFFDSDRSKCIMSKFHFLRFKTLIKQILY